MRLAIALVWLFYALWIVGGLAAIEEPGIRVVNVEPPGDPTFVSALDYDPYTGRLLFWAGGGGQGTLYLADTRTGEALAFNTSRPSAGCVSGDLALAVWPLEGRLLVIDGAGARMLGLGGAWREAQASCNEGLGVVLLVLGDEALLVAYYNGSLHGARVPGALEAEALNGTHIALALAEGLAVARPGHSVALLYPAPQGLLGLASSTTPTALVDAGNQTVIVASPEKGALEVQVLRGRGRPRVEAVGPGGIVYVRPPAGWARVLCPTPGGGWRELEAAYTRAYAFSRAGPLPDRGVWSLGILYQEGGKAVTILEVSSCRPGLAGWPETLAYLKPVTPGLEAHATASPLLPPQGLELEWSKTSPATTPLEARPTRLPVEERRGYVDWVMEAFTLASIGAAPAAAAHRILSGDRR